MKPQRLAIIIALLTVVAVVVAYLRPPKPGLDIQGGMRVVLEADTTKLPEGQVWNAQTRGAVLKILERRVNANNVSEPVIAPKGEKQFVVEMPAVKNKEQVLEQLRSTARLEFYYSPDWKTNRNPIGRYQIGESTAANGRSEYQISDVQTSQVFRDRAGIARELESLIEKGRLAEKASDVALPAPLNTLTFLNGATSARLTAEDAKRIPKLNEELTNFDRFLEEAQLILTGNDLTPNSRGDFDPNMPGQAHVSIEFDSEGRQKFAEFTRDHVNEILLAYLDGEILTAPNIQVPILDGKATISPFPNLGEATSLAESLNAGALPVPLKILQQQSIEATLGQEAVRSGMLAGIIGIGAVLIFMCGYYLLPGAVACFALILYTLFTYAVFVAIGVTFTLPGIAGFILSIGMAIDANVLIFERTKEELRGGRSLKAAVEAGFTRAFSAILDSNVCTAVTSLLLYWLGTGAVRGFAITLLLGVAISMFTAITVTRTILLLIINTPVGRNLNAWGFNRIWQTKLPVVERRNLWFAISTLVIVPGLIFVALGGLKPGIDFKGGSELVLQIPQDVSRSQVEPVVSSAGIEDPVAQIADNNTVFVRTPEMEQQQANDVVAALEREYPGTELLSFESIGSTISRELTWNATLAILLSSLFIILYLAVRFSTGGLANGLKFGFCAVIAMLHDIGVIVGVFAILGYFLNWKIDLLFVTAMLTVIGYSVHDTIVIFDRIRENLRHRSRTESFEDLVNRSVNETFSRSINTGISVMLTLAALLIWGGTVIRPMNLALFLGVISGTYSSIFNAAPLLVVWEHLAGRRGTTTQRVAATAGGPRPAAPARPAAPVRTSETPEPRGDSGASDPSGSSLDGASRTRPSGPVPQRRKRRM